MKTKTDGKIFIVLSDKGYVAIENNQIFQLWRNKSLKDIYQELKERYPNFKISLASLKRIDFSEAVAICNLYSKNNEPLETKLIAEVDRIYNPKSIINFNKVLVTGTRKMKTSNKVKLKAAAVIGINVTAGVLHLGFQSMADIICYGEAKAIQKLNVFDKTVEEIIKARKEKTSESQYYLLNTPKIAKDKAGQFYCKIKEIKQNATADYTNVKTS